jgi:hypothetical protein
MKSLILFIAVLAFWSNAYAASFTTVPALADERLMRLADIHQDLSHLHDDCGTRGYLQIAARRLNEKWENTVKQAVYFTNTGVNAPVRGVVAQALDLTDEVEMGDFLAGAFSSSVRDSSRLTKEDLRALNSFKALLGILRGDFMFYVGGHENSFGEVSYAVVVDLVNAEVLVLQADRCR